MGVKPKNSNKMKKSLLILLAGLALAACSKPEPKVMGRFVPERSDDFAWENEYVAYRLYGETLETANPGALVSPGFDVWMKDTAALIMNTRYKDELENNISYHKYYNGAKDCYKVGVSLGAGASAPLIDGQFAFAPTNYRSYDLLTGEYGTDSVAFVLHYPEWEAGSYKIALDKKIIVRAGTHFCTAEDTWTFTGPGETLSIAAGLVLHEVTDTLIGPDRLAVWEHASDMQVEPEDGMTGLAVILPGADSVYVSPELGHTIAVKAIRSGEKLTYRFGSCWSKANVPDAATWFNLVENEK